jgi:hypothetical protein
MLYEVGHQYGTNVSYPYYICTIRKSTVPVHSLRRHAMLEDLRFVYHARIKYNTLVRSRVFIALSPIAWIRWIRRHTIVGDL